MISTTRHALVRVALALLVGALAVAIPASSAAAHDTLVSMSPADGATLTTPPTKVVLTFNEAVNQQFSVIRVVDASGADVTDGTTTVSGSVVTQQLKAGLAPGAYIVTYKIISADGHPVSARTRFTVAGTASPTAAPSTSASGRTSTPSATPSAGPTMTPLASASASPSAAVSSPATAPVSRTSGATSPWLWVVLGLVVLLALGGGGWALARRGRTG